MIYQLFLDKLNLYYQKIYNYIIIIYYLYIIILPTINNIYILFYKKKCLICNRMDYFIFQKCNKPFIHTICYKCYNYPLYDNTKCHFCQIKLNLKI